MPHSRHRCTRVHTETFPLQLPAGNHLRKTDGWTAGKENSGERTTERRQRAGEAADAQPHVSGSRNQPPPAAAWAPRGQEHSCEVTHVHMVPTTGQVGKEPSKTPWWS